MAMKSETLDSWRDYFRTSNSDIFDIIERAIMVAASDCPKEFQVRRDRIAEILFSSKFTKCLGCDRVELSVPECGIKEEFGGESGGSKESKVNSSRDDQVEDMNMNQESNYSYGEAEALTDEIEEVGQIVGEVLKIKDILDKSQDEMDSMLFELLRKLELMGLSVDTLRTTEIGKSVNVLRKHANKNIRLLARKLIDVWKVMVDEWVSAATAFAEATPESVNPSTVDDEEGLPSPPLDELALFAQPTGIEFSEVFRCIRFPLLFSFFDGIDDDGNPRNSVNEYHDKGRKLPKASPNVSQRKPKVYHEPYVPEMVKRVNEDKNQEVIIKKQANIVKPNKPSHTVSGPGRLEKVNSGQKAGNGTKFQQKIEKPVAQRKPPSAQQDEHAARLEATKRKLQERYQEAQNAKRQRTIQVMELHDLPKQGLSHKPTHMKPGNRNWANGRR